MPKTTAIDAEVLPTGSLSTHTADALHNHYHRCAQTAAAQATAYAILCGLELQRIRAEVAKPGKRSDLPNSSGGGWEKWVQQNCEFGSETARKYIAVADGVKGSLAQAGMAKRLSNIVDIAPSALNTSQRENLLKSVSKVTEGKTLQQLYLDFGIVKADPLANLRKGGATHHNGRPASRNIDAEIAEREAIEILSRLAKFCQTGQHQLLEKKDLVHLDQQLLAARETFRPYVK